MKIYVCKKCGYTDLMDETTYSCCRRCGSEMKSLGLNSSEWNTLTPDERDDLIHRLLDTKAETDNSASGDQHRMEDESPDHGSGMVTYRIKNAGKDYIDVNLSRNDSFSGKGSDSFDKKAGRSTVNQKKVSVDRTHNNFSYENKSIKRSPKLPKLPRITIKPGMVFGLIMGISLLFALRSQFNENGKPLTNASSGESTSFSNDSKVSELFSNENTVYEFKDCLYYDSMEDDEKEIYQIFYDLAMHKDESGYSREIVLSNDEYEKNKDTYYLIYYAMLRDHPELFYLDVSAGRDLDIDGYSRHSTTYLTFRLGPGESNENDMIAKFNSATKSFMGDINLNCSDLEIELQIHDKLLDLVKYDYEIISVDKEDLGHTAYGVLVADSEGRNNRAVCDGYAKAFQYLLLQAGIQAAFVGGEADSASGSLSEQGSHAWNIVKLDGEWYEVDCCWDDIDIPPGETDIQLYDSMKECQPQYFYATHHWFNRTTDEMRSLPADENALITVVGSGGYTEFNHCEKSTHERKKNSKDEGYEYFSYLNTPLPAAKGTKYGFKNIPQYLIPAATENVADKIKQDQEKLNSLQEDIKYLQNELNMRSSELEDYKSKYYSSGEQWYADEHNRLLEEYNEKEREYSELVDEYNEMVEEYNNTYN